MVLWAVALLTLARLVPLSATSATGSQDPDLTVSEFLTPDTDLADTTVTETYAVTNNTTALLVATETRRLTFPNGQTRTQTHTYSMIPDHLSRLRSFRRHAYAASSDASADTGAESRIARIVVQRSICRANEPAWCLLEALGFAPIRGGYVMAIDLDQPPPEPEWPESIRVRSVVPGQAKGRQIRHLADGSCCSQNKVEDILG